MANEIISVSIPQSEDDLDILEDLKMILIKHRFVYLDMSIEFETDAIRYRFHKNA